MPVTRENYRDVLEYHKLDVSQQDAVDEVRNVTITLVDTILDFVPDCADRQAAIRHVREAMMTANAAIALKGAV